MITYKTGNLLDDDADILVNTVNCVGVMGKGIALEFKQRYPDMFASYRRDCNEGLVRIGRVWWYHTSKIIACFPTKQHWRHPSKLEWIESGLEDLRWHLSRSNDDGYFEPSSIAIPKLGCQNGMLLWDNVHDLIIDYLSDLENDIRIYI